MSIAGPGSNSLPAASRPPWLAGRCLCPRRSPPALGRGPGGRCGQGALCRGANRASQLLLVLRRRGPESVVRRISLKPVGEMCRSLVNTSLHFPLGACGSEGRRRTQETLLPPSLKSASREFSVFHGLSFTGETCTPDRTVLGVTGALSPHQLQTCCPWYQIQARCTGAQYRCVVLGASSRRAAHTLVTAHVSDSPADGLPTPPARSETLPSPWTLLHLPY